MRRSNSDLYYFLSFGTPSLISKTISSIIKKNSNACRFLNTDAIQYRMLDPSKKRRQRTFSGVGRGVGSAG